MEKFEVFADSVRESLEKSRKACQAIRTDYENGNKFGIPGGTLAVDPKMHDNNLYVIEKQQEAIEAMFNLLIMMDNRIKD